MRPEPPPGHDDGGHLRLGHAPVLADGGQHGSIADPEVEKHGGHYMWVSPDAEQLTELARLADDGKLTVRVDRTFPLEQLPDAFTASQEGHAVGKMVLTVD